MLICVWIESGVRSKIGGASTEAFQAAWEEQAVKAGSDPDVAHYMTHMPLSLVTFLKVLVWIGPLLVALLGFDSISGDLQHRGIRYWTVRTRRWSYLLGKFFGLWGIVSMVTLALTVLSSVVVLIRGYITIGDFFSWGLRCWLVSALIVGTWTAVAMFISSRFKTPLFALLTHVRRLLLHVAAGVRRRRRAMGNGHQPVARERGCRARHGRAHPLVRVPLSEHLR